jgi:predicted small lipoprotein YifL
MVCHPDGVRRVTGHVSRLITRSAALAILLAMALGLAGCGRKGGLDMPPSASITEPGAAPSNQAAGSTSTSEGFTPEGRPIAAPSGKKRLPIDVLLD